MTTLWQYTTVPIVKARLDITDSTDDTIISSVIDTVSRAIDNHTSRYFGVDATTSTRYYTADDHCYLFVDDISTGTGLLIYTDDDGDGTFENTWTATDYHLTPYNAPLSNWPYGRIEITSNGGYRFPAYVPRGVKITAKFGWPSIPDPIVAACILQSERIFKRFDSPLGTSSTTALGGQRLEFPKLDPDVIALLAYYVRHIP